LRTKRGATFNRAPLFVIVDYSGMSVEPFVLYDMSRQLDGDYRPPPPRGASSYFTNSATRPAVLTSGVAETAPSGDSYCFDCLR
jgi:hypothetical protein